MKASSDLRLAYIQWRDATHGMGEIEPKDAGLAELHTVGFISDEKPDCITLTMERQAEVNSFRLYITIPRVNIISIQVRDLGKAFPKPRKKRDADSGQEAACTQE